MAKNNKQVKTGIAARVLARDLIMPYFIVEGEHKRERIKTMPGISRLSVDNLLKDIESARNLGIKAVLLFAVPLKKYKNDAGSYAYSSENVLVKAVAAIKHEVKNITVITDICLCAYTWHGHCGVLKKDSKEIDLRATLSALAKTALVHAQAGADWVAPSAMARAQVAVIRKALDAAGYQKTKILGYSAKFASQFYGPFRDAADSVPKFGDRKAYQLDYTDKPNALKKIKDDIREGADMVMVKPALGYMDVINEAKHKFSLLLAAPRRIGAASAPLLAAYNVSGEYAFVKYGAQQGLWDERKMVHEILTSIKRAGADFIITYHANDYAGWRADEK